MGMVAKMNQRLYSWLHCPAVSTPRIGCFFTSHTWLIGEVLLMVWFMALVLSWILFWHQHEWEGKSTGGTQSPDFESDYERWARVMGQLCNLILSLLALPTARSSVWSKIVGVSWEAMQCYHRWLGVTLLLCAATHQFLFWKVWQLQGLLPQAGNGQFADGFVMFSVPIAYHTDNWTVPMQILITWAVFICMGVGALSYVRRNHFEIFYYSHHVFLILYIGALWHASSLWYTLSGGLALYAVDRILRFASGCQVAHVSCLRAQGDAEFGWTDLVIDSKDGSVPLFTIGQYIFINIPAVSLLQWHPFTIASAPHEKVMRCHIKNMGPGTWTDGLWQLAHGNDSDGMTTNLTVNVDGAYGLSPELWRYDRLVLVLGGIGITPGLSILKQLFWLDQHADRQVPAVQFIWALKTPTGLAVAADFLREINTHPNYDVRAYLTKTHKKASQDMDLKKDAQDLVDPEDAMGFSVTYGSRPNFEALFGEHARNADEANASGAPVLNGRTLVFACGPESMVQSTMDHAHRVGMHFHSETFEL